MWDEVAGQAEAVSLLRAAAADVGMTHSWLLTGPPGSGRSNLAYAFATALIARPGDEEATAAQVALGNRIYHGQVANASCTGCHGDDAKGTPLGPDLTSSQWLWGDGSLPSIKRIITEGVPQPKNYRSAMPPMGGAPLSPAEIDAVSAYVWAISHRDRK